MRGSTGVSAVVRGDRHSVSHSAVDSLPCQDGLLTQLGRGADCVGEQIVGVVIRTPAAVVARYPIAPGRLVLPRPVR